MTRYTRILSKATTRYLPFIALALSLYGAQRLCSAAALVVIALPFVLLAFASLSKELSFRARLAAIIIYFELIALIAVKSGLISMG